MTLAPSIDDTQSRPMIAVLQHVVRHITPSVRMLSSAAAVVSLVAGCGGGAGGDSAAQTQTASSDSASAQQVDDAGERRDATSAYASVTSTASSTITVHARATLFDNVGPNMQLRVNGTVVASVEVRASAYQDYSFPVTAVAGGSKVDVVFTNDAYRPPQDRNLYVASITVNGVTIASTASGVVYDIGSGSAAFDGKNVVAGTASMLSSGALRFVAPSATSDVPVILNASPTTRAGDYVSIQGWNFGTAPTVWLDSSDGSSTQLPTLNTVGTGWVSVQVPTGAHGGMAVRVQNGTSYSAPAKLNAARAYHLDALQIVPGGAVRIFGRNLQLSGSTAAATFDGLPGFINVAASNEHMLVVTAPSGLPATKASVITVDNGNGTGASTLDRKIDVIATDRGDPFSLGVGWAASLSNAASKVIDAKTDTRLHTHTVCNGTTDDTSALRAAVALASSVGGATIRLPAGVCRVSDGIQLLSGVVIQGTGKSSTTLSYSIGPPIYAGSVDSAGLADMTIANAGAATEGILLHDSTRVFLKNVKFNLGTTHQLFLTNNKNMVITGCEFNQSGSLNEQGPYVVAGSQGFVFTDNITRIMAGSSSFDMTSDGYIADNHFTRDGAFQSLSTVFHTFTMNFAARLAVIDNVFDVANGPITAGHNDGETLLTEGGGNARTENLGSVQSATGTTITDTNNTINVDPLGTGSIPENYGVAIVAGKGVGQTRRIVSYANKAITVDTAWSVVPDATSRYATMVWGMEKSLIKGNALANNPRGILLYQTGVREVDIIGNQLSENGGIYLRSYQSLDSKQFMPMYNVKLAKNKVANANRLFPANIVVVFVNHDGKDYGTPNIGIDVQDNDISANVPNVNSNLYDYAGIDGYTNEMRVETSYYETTANPRLLGDLLQRNTCTNCDVAFRLGTGSNGAMLMSNTLINTKTWWTNERTTTSSEVATATKTK